MPRTKATTTKRKNDDKALITKMFKDFEEEVERRKAQRLNKVENFKTLITVMINTMKTTMNAGSADKTIAELDSMDDNSILKSMSKESVLHLTQSKSSKKVKRSLSYTEDDGYLTAESSECASTGRRTSRSRTKQATLKNSRVSRSLSRSNLQKTVNVAKSYKTPTHQRTNPATFGTVTPKMKPNTPQVLLRRPNAGEVAISLQGSPLMLNSGGDSVPNVNIPLMDGRMLCIQPQRGLRVSQIPELDADTKRQIQALRDNLDRVCGGFMNRKKK